MINMEIVLRKLVFHMGIIKKILIKNKSIGKLRLIDIYKIHHNFLPIHISLK